MADNVLTRKAGPLKVWQWGAIGGAAGLGVLVLSKGKGEKKTPPEEEEKLLGGLRAGGGGGGESVPGAISPDTSSTPITPTPGEPGVAGAPGTPGTPGATAAEVAAELNPRLSGIESQLGQHTSAPQAKVAPAGQYPFTNSKGEKYKLETKPNGDIVHRYKNGHTEVVQKGASKSQANAKAQVKAKANGKSQATKQRGNHTTTAGKPNHAKPVPLKDRVKTDQAAKDAQKRAREKAERERREAERKAREKREREARERREREARERRKREEEARNKRAAARRK